MGKKKLTSFESISSFLEQVAGEHAPKLVEIYEKKRGSIEDEKMAKAMDLKVTDVRTILNRLHYRGIANYDKERNKETGWYSYTWDINQKRILELVIEKQREEIEKMKQRKESEDVYSYFSCEKEGHEFPFAIAAEYQFKCPECGQELKCIDTEKRRNQLMKKMKKMKKEIEKFEKEIER